MNVAILLTVKILLFVRHWAQMSRTQIPTPEDIPVLFYYFYNNNYREHKHTLSIHVHILTQNGKWHRWISCGRK